MTKGFSYVENLANVVTRNKPHISGDENKYLVVILSVPESWLMPDTEGYRRMQRRAADDGRMLDRRERHQDVKPTHFYLVQNGEGSNDSVKAALVAQWPAKRGFAMNGWNSTQSEDLRDDKRSCLAVGWRVPSDHTMNDLKVGYRDHEPVPIADYELTLPDEMIASENGQ